MSSEESNNINISNDSEETIKRAEEIKNKILREKVDLIHARSLSEAGKEIVDLFVTNKEERAET